MSVYSHALSTPAPEPVAKEDLKAINEVIIDSVSLFRIVKHCNDNSSSSVAGSLLGLDGNGTLEVTYSFPATKAEGEAAEDAADDLDGDEYLVEMMTMLEIVNIDNYCVGWYESMYLGTVCTSDVVGYQYNYQTSDRLSPNSVVIMYDPIQSKRGNIVVKAFRLTQEFLDMKRNKSNKFIYPHEILEEVPLKIRNSGHSAAFLKSIHDANDFELNSDFEALSLSSLDNYSERHLEAMSDMLEDLVQEQQKLQMYSKGNSKLRQEHIRWLVQRIKENIEARENGDEEVSTRIADSGLKPMPEVPNRVEPLLMLEQLARYCKQLNDHVDNSLQRVLVTSQLHSAM